jgi:hypothetical protein
MCTKLPLQLILAAFIYFAWLITYTLSLEVSYFEKSLYKQHEKFMLKHLFVKFVACFQAVCRLSLFVGRKNFCLILWPFFSFFLIHRPDLKIMTSCYQLSFYKSEPATISNINSTVTPSKSFPIIWTFPLGLSSVVTDTRDDVKCHDTSTFSALCMFESTLEFMET